MRQTAISMKLRQAGMLDYRNAVVFAKIESLHGKSKCLACVSGNLLRILQSDNRHLAGRTLEEIQLSEITNLNTSDFPPAPFILFDYNGIRFALTRFSNARDFIRIIRWETNRYAVQPPDPFGSPSV